MFFFIFQEVSMQLYAGISFEISGKRKTMLKDCTSTIVLGLRHSAAKWPIKYATFIKSNLEQHIKLKSLKVVSLRYRIFKTSIGRFDDITLTDDDGIA